MATELYDPDAGCWDCDGDGFPERDCPTCGMRPGEALAFRVALDAFTATLALEGDEPCDACQGSGINARTDLPCHACEGEG